MPAKGGGPGNLGIQWGKTYQTQVAALKGAPHAAADRPDVYGNGGSSVAPAKEGAPAWLRLQIA